MAHLEIKDSPNLINTNLYEMPPSFTPLVNALDHIGFRLERAGDFRIITAHQSRRELMHQRVPSHIDIISRPLKGTRKILRGARYEARLIQARWPQDQMEEGTLPCLLCVTSGQAHIYIADYILRCSVGDFIYIPAGVPKGDRFHQMPGGPTTEQSEVLWCYPGALLGEGVECWISRYHNDEPVREEQQSVAQVKNYCLAALFTQLCEDIEHAADATLLHALLRAFILQLHHDINEGRAIIPPAKRSSQPIERSYDPIEYALRYVDAHLNDSLTIAHVARQSALSETSFKRRFREQTGETFNRYLRKKRLEFAAEQLRNSYVDTRRIARQVGLTYAQLNNLFKDIYQCTPGEYRKRHR